MKDIIERLKKSLGDKVVGLLVAQFLTEENIKSAIDYVLDIAEDACKKNSIAWDDEALAKVRLALNIPDNDGPK